MTLSAMAVPSVAMRDASHGGTRPPCSGRSAVPERFTRLLSHLSDGTGRPRCHSEDFLDGVNLVLVHAVSHARIDPLVHVRVHPAEHVSRFVNSFERDVWIDIAAPEEHRRAAERPGVVPLRPRRPDETATEREHAGVSAGVTCPEIAGQGLTPPKPGG